MLRATALGWLCLARLAWAGPEVSAARAPGESFEAASVRALEAFVRDGGIAFSGITPLSASEEPSGRALSELPSWPSLEEAQADFRSVRDQRFLPSPQDPHFPRRDPWLYPDDGCFARAQSIVQQLAHNGRPKPAKLFIFGNLTLRTPYSPSGEVSWWYHVVPAISVDGTAMILDPSVDPKRALPLEEWVSKMTPDPSQARITVCDSQAYDPYSQCSGASAESARQRAAEDLPEFLNLEWYRILNLGLNPRRVLGDSPPWLQGETSELDASIHS